MELAAVVSAENAPHFPEPSVEVRAAEPESIAPPAPVVPPVDEVKSEEATIEAAIDPNGFTARLLDDRATEVREDLVRLATGLGLASIYGVALGARAGGRAFFVHALGVPAALAAVGLLGVPALAIALALLDAPIDARVIGRAAARAAGVAGLMLAGLAPAAALYVVTSESSSAASFAASAGLLFGGFVAGRRFTGDLSTRLAKVDFVKRGAASIVFLAFSAFAGALAIRVWWSLLPVLGGSR